MNKLETGDKKRICITQDAKKRELLDKEQDRLRLSTHSAMLDYITDFYFENKDK